MGIEPATLWSRVKGPIQYTMAPPHSIVHFTVKMPSATRAQTALTLKEPGSFDPISQPGGEGGGGGDSAPPSDLGRGATKNYEIRHVRRVSQYERADKIAILKIKAFLNYANLC